MAYTTALIKQKDEPLTDGRVRVVVTFTGNAGEPARDIERYIDASDTVPGLRLWAFQTAANLGARKTVADLLTVGQTITLTAPPAPPAPTGEEVWRAKAARLLRATDLGLTNSTAVSDLAALRADVNATYVTGYL